MDGEASYKKLRDGGWGIRTVGYVPAPGDTVDVTTKGGEVKAEEVSKVVWSGKNDDGDETAICEIVKKDKDGNPVQQQPRQQQQGTAGGGQRGGAAGSGGPKCRCHACGTTQAAEYYCTDCVLNGGAQQSADAKRPGPEDEIPF